MTKELKPEFTEKLATEFVTEIESKYLDGLERKFQEAQRDSDSAACNCYSCRKRRDKNLEETGIDYRTEKFRIENPHQIDEEEDILADLDKLEHLTNDRWLDMLERRRREREDNSTPPLDADLYF